MEDPHIRFGCGKLIRGKDVAILKSDVIVLIKETLALDTGHVENIKFGQDLHEVGGLNVFDILAGEDLLLYITGKFELLGGNKDNLDSGIARKSGNEGVDGSAEFEVAAKAYGEVIESTDLTFDGEQVGKGLGGVIMSAVACVYDRDIGVFDRDAGCAFLGVAHCDDIGVAIDHADSIGDAFAFGCGRRGRLGEAEDISAQVEHCRFKAEAGTG